jgi:hypothetical protein
VEKLHRRGSETVYVCRQYPDGLVFEGYRDLIARDPQAKGLAWHTMQRVGEVYATGKVRHPDHRTIVLPFWHQVLMSEEPDARGANMVFLD